ATRLGEDAVLAGDDAAGVIRERAAGIELDAFVTADRAAGLVGHGAAAIEFYSGTAARRRADLAGIVDRAAIAEIDAGGIAADRPEIVDRCSAVGIHPIGAAIDRARAFVDDRAGIQRDSIARRCDQARIVDRRVA